MGPDETDHNLYPPHHPGPGSGRNDPLARAIARMRARPSWRQLPSAALRGLLRDPFGDQGDLAQRRDRTSVAALATDRTQVAAILGASIDREEATTSRALRSSSNTCHAGRGHLTMMVRLVKASALARFEARNDPRYPVGRPFTVGPHVCDLVAGEWQVHLTTSADLEDPTVRAAAFRLVETTLATLVSAT